MHSESVWEIAWERLAWESMEVRMRDSYGGSYGAYGKPGTWGTWHMKSMASSGFCVWWAMLDECLLSNGHRSWVYGRRGSAGSTGLVWDLLVRWDLLDLLVLSNPIGYVGSSRQIQPAPQDLPVLSQIYWRSYRRRPGVPGLHFKQIRLHAERLMTCWQSGDSNI